MKAKEKPPKSDFKTSDFGGFCLMALTGFPAHRPVTSRGSRILRRGFPLALCGRWPCSGFLFPPQPAAGRDPYGNLPRAALSRAAAPASCGAVSPPALCGRRPCSGSLFPPQAAVACAALPRTEAADLFHGLQKSPRPGVTRTGIESTQFFAIGIRLCVIAVKNSLKRKVFFFSRKA